MKKFILLLLIFYTTYCGFAQNTITLGGLSSSNYCIQNSISVPFTTNIPFGTQFIARLKRGNEIITTGSSYYSPINLYTNLTHNIIYSTEYTVDVISGSINSNNSPNFTMGNILEAYVSDGLNKPFLNDDVCQGKSKIYYATIKDKSGNLITDNVNIQWKKNGVNIEGANSNSLLVTQPAYYTFVVTQGGCVVNARYNVNFYYHDYSFKSYNIFVDGDNIACIGTSKKLELAYKTTTSTYQWLKNGILIPGATERVYFATESGIYNANIDDVTCTMGGVNTKLNFTESLNPIAFPDYADTTTCNGSYVRLIANYNEASPNQYNYQWQKNDVNLESTSFQSSNVYSYSTNEPGKYRVIYSQGNCTSKSDEITVISSNKAQKPILTIGNQYELCQGSIQINPEKNKFSNNIYQTNNFYIGTSNIMGGRYFKNDVEIAPITYTSTIIVTQPGTYKMLYGNGSCEIESNSITLNFNPNPLIPKIFAENNKTNICGNSDYVFMKFDIPYTGNTYSYQWKRNGINITSNGTNSSYFAQTAGDYSVLVTNGTCSGISNSITVTLDNSPILDIFSNKNEVFCSNQLFKLQTPYLKNTIWTLNDVIIPNETQNYLYANQAGIYKGQINTGGCVAESLPFNLNVNIPNEIFSTKSGNWTDPTCWICNILPNSLNDAKISNGHNIVVPLGVHEVKNIKLEGTVNFEEGGEIKVNGGN